MQRIVDFYVAGSIKRCWELWGQDNRLIWQILVQLEQVLCELFRLACPIHCLPCILTATCVNQRRKMLNNLCILYFINNRSFNLQKSSGMHRRFPKSACPMYALPFMFLAMHVDQRLFVFRIIFCRCFNMNNRVFCLRKSSWLRNCFPNTKHWQHERMIQHICGIVSSLLHCLVPYSVRMFCVQS